MNSYIILKEVCQLAFESFAIYISYSHSKNWILQDFIPSPIEIKYPKRYQDYLRSLLVSPLYAGYFWLFFFNSGPEDAMSAERKIAPCILISISSILGVILSHKEIDKRNEVAYNDRLKREIKSQLTNDD